MLSGSGRHRRPRQAPALLVAAGVTGSAIAIPLLAATGASAAEGTVWDQVAQCETGGSWSADKGTGEYGGLSLTQERWETYGGLDYAASPGLASRNQQIAVAQKLLAAEGVGAWGTCGLTSGLTKESGALNVDTGIADGSSGSSGLSDLSKGESGSSASGGSAGSGATSSPGASDSTEGSASSSPSSSSSPSPSSSASSADEEDAAASEGAAKPGGAAKGGGTPSGSPEADESGESDKWVQDVGSWSLVDTGTLGSGGRHRGATAEEGPSDGLAPASAGRHAAEEVYTVQDGDSLASITDSLGLEGGWRALYEENLERIGADPSVIVPGQALDTGAE
ncbi:LysM peptidoglycan-binding domain-containing protein [Streptomyces antibioticus]|uniref:LysM peptidoglycan-binding domain-containing protein n=1 Tax=Streptomyces antibioticus TaxID=1890 RepID=A0AAE6Y9L8_STRAT|nr:transglycosylase family protein [Streptomyces antibioticus]QIT44927.1 LysM peptidoglycan-binding domain-containing protein [Streptomyces antibioticus]